MDNFSEFSINNLLSRVGSSLASDLTQFYSKERRIDYKMANTPRFTKLADTFYDKANDSVTFTFLTYATPKPKDNVEDKFQIDPLQGFTFDKNELKIYDIMLRFFNVSTLMSIESPTEPIRKSRKKVPVAQTPEELPNIPAPEEEKEPEEASIDTNFKAYSDEDEEVTSMPSKPSTLGEARVTVMEAKEWLYNADFALWSNSPSFHWQGFNYKLSQLQASIFPTNIAPTSGPKGWKNRHGNALVDKHLLELFYHIKFFINQMASSMLNKIRGSRRENTMFEFAKLRESTNIKITPSGTSFSYGEEPYVVGIFPDYNLKYGILEVSYKKSEASFKLNFDKELSTEQRVRIYNAIEDGDTSDSPTSLVCVGFSAFGKGDSFNDSYEHPSKEELDSGLQELCCLSVCKYMDEFSPDIFSFHATDMDAYGKFILKVASMVEKDQEDSYIVERATTGKYAMSVFLIKKEAYGFMFGEPLNEAELKNDEATPDSESQGEEVHPEYKDVSPSEEEALDSDDNEAPEDSLPTKELVCSLITASPLTSDHIPLIKKLKEIAQEKNTSPVLFILPQEGYESDHLSAKAKSDIVSSLFPSIKIVEIYEEVDCQYSAMVWAYNQKYTDVTVVCGSDDLQEVIELFDFYNGRLTKQGKFRFKKYDAVSYGGGNPDSMKKAVVARNAQVAQDVESFMSNVIAPYQNRSKNIVLAKKLFMILDYEQESLGIV